VKSYRRICAAVFWGGSFCLSFRSPILFIVTLLFAPLHHRTARWRLTMPWRFLRWMIVRWMRRATPQKNPTCNNAYLVKYFTVGLRLIAINGVLFAVQQGRARQKRQRPLSSAKLRHGTELSLANSSVLSTTSEQLKRMREWRTMRKIYIYFNTSRLEKSY
jgi:hypothetical protein